MATTLSAIAAVMLLAQPLPRASANVLQNGSFEVGLYGWGFHTRGTGGYPYDVKVVGQDPAPTVVEAPDAPDGRRVLAYSLPAHGSFKLFSRAYEATAGRYRLNASFRGAQPVTVQLVDAGRAKDNVLGSMEAPAGEQWADVSVAVDVPAETTALAVNISGQGEGTYALDGVALLKEGEAPGPEQVALGLSAPRRGVFHVSEDRPLTASLFSPVPLWVVLRYRVEDARGEEVGSGGAELDLPAGGTLDHAIDLYLPYCGHYRVLAQVTVEGKAVGPIAEALVAVIPDRELPSDSAGAAASRYGCNMEHRPFLLDLARRIGIRWVFCAPPVFTKWFSVEPRPGEWLFYDDELAAFEAAGIAVVANLADAPSWATRPGHQGYGGPWPNAYFPADWADWETYVRRSVEHYSPRIRHWGVWNEPNHQGFLKLAEGETWPEKYRVILEHTYPVVKQADPQAVVIGGTVTNPGALPALVSGPASALMDVAAFHWSSWSPQGYVRGTGEELGYLGPKDKWVNCIQRITDAMAQSGRKLPLWNTECHITEADIAREFTTQPDPPRAYGTPRMSALDAAAAVPRQYITEWAAGVGKTFYWLLGSYGSSWQPRTAITLTEWDRSPTAALATYAVMTDLLADAALQSWETETDQESLERPTFWTFEFRCPTGRLRVIWGNRDAEHERLMEVTGEQVRVLDMFGVELPGVSSMSAVELQGKVLLPVGRCPLYVFDGG